MAAAAAVIAVLIVFIPQGRSVEALGAAGLGPVRRSRADFFAFTLRPRVFAVVVKRSTVSLMSSTVGAKRTTS